MKPAERLKLARERAGYKNTTAFVAANEQYGISMSAYRSHENGHRQITPTAAALYAKILRTTASYILFGDGDEPNQRELTKTNDNMRIVELDVRGGAGMAEGALSYDNQTDGNGNTFSSDGIKGLWEFPTPYLSEIHVEPKSIRMIEILGDSMIPSLCSGDRVMVDTSDKRPSPPGIFALWDGFGVVVKRIEHIMKSDPPRLNITSDNPRHQAYELTSDEVEIIGRVIWVGRRI